MIASKLIDEVDIDVVPLDMCGNVLGSPYFYDRKAALFFHENKYDLTKDEVEYIFISHRAKIRANLVSAGHMKRLVNSSKGYMLMFVREKYVDAFESFQVCDPTHKKELYEFFSNYNEIFQEPGGLPLKREIQHEIHLQQDFPLPNIGMYRLSTIEMEEIKKQVQELLNQGVIRPSCSLCGSLIVLVQKKDCTWTTYHSKKERNFFFTLSLAMMIY